MILDKMKLAYLNKSYWGRAFQTSVRTAPQDGQSLHDFGCAQGVSRTKRGTVRRATDGLNELFIKLNLISTYSWFLNQNATKRNFASKPHGKIFGWGLKPSRDARRSRNPI